jgi:hypothetical protein
MSFTDFPNGLSGADQYLNPLHHERLDLQGSVEDIARFIVPADTAQSLKEIVCSLLSGRGLKLPNLQICQLLNLQELLNLPNLQAGLQQAIGQLTGALQQFLDHTRIEDTLGRISHMLSEITNIANMINFCSAPIDPIAVPNLLEQGMQSFLGGGMDILNKIGEMVPSEIPGCSIPGQFNCQAFSGGILGRICDNIDDVKAGTASQDFIDLIQADVNNVVGDINNLIDSESGISGTYDVGGSDFADDRPVNEGIGVLHNGPDAGIQGNTRIAGQLKALYDNLGSYQVVGNDGTVYNNIFETFVEPDLLRLLRRGDPPTQYVAERQPVYNYCGKIVGYTDAVTQAPITDSSSGSAPAAINQPGFNAGGLPTDAQSVAQANEAAEESISVDPTEFNGTHTTTDGISSVVAFDDITPPNDTVWFVEVQATAKRTDAVGVTSIRLEGLIDNTAGVPVLTGTFTRTVFNETVATNNYDAAVVVTPTGSINVEVQGNAGHTVSWAVRLKYQEV